MGWHKQTFDPSQRLWLVVRVALGLLLLTASWLKFVGAGIDANDALNFGLGWMPIDVEAITELLLGVWLLVDPYPRLSWWLAVGAFIAFFGIALDRSLSGAESCGCFGKIRVPPRYMAAIDAGIIITLVLLQPSTAEGPNCKRYRWALFSVFAAAALVGTSASQLGGNWRPVDSMDQNAATAEKSPPREWVGQPFPLSSHIDGGGRLMKGRWVVMFYHPDCAACRVALTQYVALGYQLAAQSRTSRVALVEVPPFEASAAMVPPTDGMGYFRSRLAEGTRLSGRLPLFILVESGTVSKVTTDPTALLRELGASGEPEREDGVMFPDYRELRRRSFLREIACGPLALIAVLREFGLDVPPDEAEQLYEEAGDLGIDLLRLKELVEAKGFHAMGISTSAAGLRRIGLPAIAHLNRYGFVAVVGYRPNGVDIVYPLQPKGVVPDELFARSFGEEGRALIVSQEPLDPGRLGLRTPDAEAGFSGPHLRLSRSVLAAGRIHHRTWQAKVTLTNDGAEPLLIGKVSSDCNCFEFTIDQKTVPPRSATELRVTGREISLGAFTYHLNLETNDPSTPTLKLPVRGYLEYPVALNPPVASMRNIPAGIPAETVLEVEVPRGLDPRKLQARRAGPLGPIDSHFLVDLRIIGPRVEAKVRWGGNRKPATYRQQFEIVYGDSPDALGTPLACAAEVVPAVSARPPSLLLHRGLAGAWKRQIEVLADTDYASAPTLNWSDAELQKVIQSNITRNQDKRWVIELSGLYRDLTATAIHSGSLNIDFGRGVPLVVPVRLGDETQRPPSDKHD